MFMNIRFTKYFQKQVKKIAKSFPSVESDLEDGFCGFFEDHSVVNLGKNIFKLRVRNSDLHCGKSGGYRLIVYFSSKKKVLLPLLLFSKRKKQNVSFDLIEKSLEMVIAEIEANKTHE